MKKQRRMIKSDIISNLPDSVIESILVKLPIKDAVQTSALSRTWRDKWTTIPDLYFSPSPSTETERIRTHRLSSFIDRVLLFHKGPILKFELYMPRAKSTVVNSWINFLSRNGIKELSLSFDFENLCITPPSVFSCEALTCLELCGCVINLPTMFNGFSSLKSLLLDHVSLFAEELETMLSKCSTVLERLELVGINGCSYFNIRGPNLKYFYLRAEFEGICFEDTPNLSCVSIILINGVLDEVGAETSNWIEVLGGLPALEKLYLEGYSLEFLAMSSVPQWLPFTLDCLKSISLGINFEDLNETSVILCLVRSSPNLQELKIKVYTKVKTAIEWPEDYWEVQDSLACSMNQLRVVKMTGLFGARPELEFLKLLLANSPVLEILSITPKLGQMVTKYKMLKELVRFRRASTNAEIDYNPSQGFTSSRTKLYND